MRDIEIDTRRVGDTDFQQHRYSIIVTRLTADLTSGPHLALFHECKIARGGYIFQPLPLPTPFRSTAARSAVHQAECDCGRECGRRYQ